MDSVKSKRQLRLVIALALGVFASIGGPLYGDSLSEAIYVFAREKSAAAQTAVMLKENATNDPSKLSRGIQLYADAKAAFDGPIDQLEHDLQGPDSPQVSATFDSRPPDGGSEASSLCHLCRR